VSIVPLLRIFVLLCCTIFLTARHPACAANNKSVERGTILRSCNTLGRQNTYINETGVRIEYPIAGLNLICKKPSYEIIWFNPQSKLMMKESIATYRQRTGQPAIERDMSRMPHKNVDFAGTLATRITFKLSNNVDKTGLPDFSTRSTSTVSHSNFYVLMGVVQNEMLKTFINSFMHVPASGGIPVALVHDRSDGTRTTEFKVERVERNATFPKDVFDAPKGFKTVHSQTAIAQGPGYKSQIDDLERDMGLGEPLGK
jgi:hypothetical protein